MGKIYTLTDKRATQADRAIMKLKALAKSMDFCEEKWTTEMFTGFKYIIDDATSEIREAVFWEDTHD